MDGRLTIPIVFGEYAKLNERVIRNSAKLIYKNREFYLQAVVEVPEEQLKEIQDFLGVDLGIVNLAATSDGILYSGGQTEEVRKHYVDLRGRLPLLSLIILILYLLAFLSISLINYLFIICS
jgi:putative transposase